MNCFARTRAKQLANDTWRRQFDICEAERTQLVCKGRCSHHQATASTVEPTKPSPRPAFRNREARGKIFRKPCVQARRKGQAVLDTMMTHRMTDRPFRRDVNRFSVNVADTPSDYPWIRQGKPNLRISR